VDCKRELCSGITKPKADIFDTNSLLFMFLFFLPLGR
jgi:hypothetical protein